MRALLVNRDGGRWPSVVRCGRQREGPSFWNHSPDALSAEYPFRHLGRCAVCDR